MTFSISRMSAVLSKPAGSGRVCLVQRGQLPAGRLAPGRLATRPRPLKPVCAVGPVVSDAVAQVSSSYTSILVPDYTSTLAYTIAEMSPETAGTVASLLGPFLSVGTLVFILRIITTWYPEIDGKKLPWLLVYFPTEWILVPARKVIPPQFGVDVSPIVMVAILSFLNEILLGPQGILNLIQRQQLAM